ncbi:hypothetical protein [Ferrimonas kyonanensis]|uniref:hypothetical protein n=1 Tax=Ferrimonas kyonanensis TaxID=364763 RepID=UPI000426FA07|nr:hypothetical protein [Ferrimonas kyonanensis]
MSYRADYLGHYLDRLRGKPAALCRKVVYEELDAAPIRQAPLPSPKRSNGKPGRKATLPDAVILALLRERFGSDLSSRELSAKFNVPATTVRAICSGSKPRYRKLKDRFLQGQATDKE